MEVNEELYTRLGLSPERVIGYAYAGLYTAIVAALLAPDATKKLLDSLGGLLSPLAALASGIGVYVLYRNLIGEYLLYPFQHLIHRIVDLIAQRSGERLTCSMTFLAYLGVPFGSRRDAYTLIREVLLKEKTCRRLDLMHGELHVLYITTCGCVVAVLHGLLSPGRTVASMRIIIGVLSYIAAIICDTHQHSVETQMLKRLDRNHLRKFLFDAGYLPVENAKVHASIQDMGNHQVSN